MTKQNAYARSRRAQRGFTVLEIIVVLVVGSILAALAVYGWQLTHQAKGQDESSLMTFAGTCAKGVYSNSPDFTGVTISALATPANGCFPAKDVSGSAGNYTVKDSYGHVITATPATLANANDSVAFTISGVSDQDCAAAMQTLGTTASQLTGGPVGNGGATPVLPYQGAYSPTNAATACAATSNDIIYYVSK